MEQKTEKETDFRQATKIQKANIRDDLLDVIKLIMPWKHLEVNPSRFFTAYHVVHWVTQVLHGSSANNDNEIPTYSSLRPHIMNDIVFSVKINSCSKNGPSS